MIRATKLMLGDWVLCWGKYVRVKAIRSNKYLDGDDVFELIDAKGVICTSDTVEPIPLTPEILEKNGAVYSVYEHPYFYYEPTEEELNEEYKNYPFYCYKIGGCVVTFYPDKISVSILGIDFVNKFEIRGRKGIVYLHELQHALRLCGIEKEIEL